MALFFRFIPFFTKLKHIPFRGGFSLADHRIFR